MQRPKITLALVTVLVATVASSLTAADPPRPGTDGNGLDENESATLWSRDDDSRYISNAAYREAYGENRTTIHQIANGTDLTFTRPPTTARIWTRNDYADFTPGNRSTSVYPVDAQLTNSTFIADAHATVFAVMPSTKAHRTPTDTTWYVAPEGRVRGIVDYRIRTPANRSVSNGTAKRTVLWTVQDHDITEVRLLQDGTVVARTDGSQLPVLNYSIGGRETTLTLEADIEVRVRKTVIVERLGNVSAPNTTAAPPNATVSRPNTTDGRSDEPTATASGTTRNGTAATGEPATGSNVTVPRDPGQNGTRTITNRSVVIDSVTVSDELDVQVYDLNVSMYTATYPDTDIGVAIFKNRPWQGYTLTPDETARVRGVWRFYTARDMDWDTLTKATADGSERIESDALPVYVHAYPSKLRPRTEPTRIGPDFIEIWGVERPTPAGTLGENVTVDVVTDPYETSYGMAVRYRDVDRDALTVHGIVQGVNATLVDPERGRERHVRESELTVDIVARNESGATLRLELRDATTDHPISLTGVDGPRYEPILEDMRAGYITVADQRVKTNESGLATVRVTESGVYTARYHPGSWLRHDPAYTGDTATVRWHPLTTVAGWFALVVQTFQWFLPFAFAVYAGRKLGRMFRWGGEQ